METKVHENRYLPTNVEGRTLNKAPRANFSLAMKSIHGSITKYRPNENPLIWAKMVQQETSSKGRDGGDCALGVNRIITPRTRNSVVWRNDVDLARRMLKPKAPTRNNGDDIPLVIDAHRVWYLDKIRC